MGNGKPRGWEGKGKGSRTSVIQSCVLIIHAPKDGEEATGIAFPVDR